MGIFHRCSRRSGRLWGVAGMLALSGVLSGYVTPSPKILARWTATRPPLRAPLALPVQLGDRTGRLYVATPGRHALVLDGEPARFDPGPGWEHPLAALWRGLDLFAGSSEEELARTLEAAGLDVTRGGYARTDRSVDGVAHTVGARGEGEPHLPQVWFARDPLWPCRVRLPSSGDAEIGPPGVDGTPAWFLLPDSEVLLMVTGSPFVPAAVPTAPDPLRRPWQAPLPDWRRAFEGMQP